MPSRRLHRYKTISGQQGVIQWGKTETVLGLISRMPSTLLTQPAQTSKSGVDDGNIYWPSTSFANPT